MANKCVKNKMQHIKSIAYKKQHGSLVTNGT